MRKSDLIVLCKSKGIMLTDSGDCIRIDSPVGYRLEGNDLHYFDIYTKGWTRAEIYEELSKEIGSGIVKCEDSKCDSCVNDPMTFEEIHTLYGGVRLA